MNASELSKVLNETLTEVGWSLSGFCEFWKLDQDVIENCINDEKYPSTREQMSKEQLLLDRLGAFSRVQQERTGSDMDVMQYVYHFKKHDIYLAVDGSYSSWDGVDFYGSTWYEVKPRQVMTTVYERVS